MAYTKLEARNTELENFARIMSYDIKAPVVSTLLLAEVLVADHSIILSELIDEIKGLTTDLKEAIETSLLNDSGANLSANRGA